MALQEEGKVKVLQLEPESKSLLAMIWQALQQDTQTSITDLPELTQLIAAGSSLGELLAGRSGQKDHLKATFKAQQKVRRPLLQLPVWSFISVGNFVELACVLKMAQKFMCHV